MKKLGSLLGVVFAFLYFYGTYHAFAEHGVGHGIGAAVFVPYGIYMGVEGAIDDRAEESQWREMSELLGLVIVAHAHPDYSMSSARETVSDRERLRTWIRSLSRSRKSNLQREAANLAHAVYSATEADFEALFAGDLPPADAFVEPSEIREVSNQGLQSAWSQFSLQRTRDLLTLHAQADQSDGSWRERVEGLRDKADAALRGIRSGTTNLLGELFP